MFMYTTAGCAGLVSAENPWAFITRVRSVQYELIIKSISITMRTCTLHAVSAVVIRSCAIPTVHDDRRASTADIVKHSCGYVLCASDGFSCRVLLCIVIMRRGNRNRGTGIGVYYTAHRAAYCAAVRPSFADFCSLAEHYPLGRRSCRIRSITEYNVVVTIPSSSSFP